MALISAVCSMRRGKPTPRTTPATHGQHWYCAMVDCRSTRTCCLPAKSWNKCRGSRRCRRRRQGDQQGGCEPSGHTTLVPGGTTTVVLEGGGGLLLLKLRQPPSNSGSSRDNRRMGKRPHRQSR